MTPNRIHLEVIEIPKPCPADWNAMEKVDGDRDRFCRHCDRHVYNLSEMSRREAEDFIADRYNPDAVGHLCVRMYKRADGTVVTTDCRGKWRASAARWAVRWGGPIGSGPVAAARRAWL